MARRVDDEIGGAVPSRQPAHRRSAEAEHGAALTAQERTRRRCFA